MKHNPRVPEDQYAGWFIYNGTEYRVLVRNDDDDEIPHYYLKDMNSDHYCGFILNENLTEPYHKDHHNFIFEDEALITAMKRLLTTVSKMWKCTRLEVLDLYWRSDYDKKEYE